MRRDFNQPYRCGRAARARLWLAAAAAVVIGWGAAPALALDIKAQEKAALKVCEKRFCDIVLGHDTTTPSFQCHLSKTWTKRNIKDSVDGKTRPWSLGDARCSADASVIRGALVEVLAGGNHRIEFLPHVVHCEVENGDQISVIDVTLGPKFEFKDGQAVRAWIKLKHVEGPGSWKATLWTLAKVEDTLGLFQNQVLKSINKLVHETCPANYPALKSSTPGAAATASKPAAAKNKPTVSATPNAATAAESNSK